MSHLFNHMSPLSFVKLFIHPGKRDRIHWHFNEQKEKIQEVIKKVVFLKDFKMFLKKEIKQPYALTKVKRWMETLKKQIL